MSSEDFTFEFITIIRIYSETIRKIICSDVNKNIHFMINFNIHLCSPSVEIVVDVVGKQNYNQVKTLRLSFITFNIFIMIVKRVQHKIEKCT